MELTHPHNRLSALLDRPVVDRSGRRVGRVYEVRATIDPGGVPVVKGLMIGPRALLRRMRGPHTAAEEIPWEQVVEIDEDRIVISGR